MKHLNLKLQKGFTLLESIIVAAIAASSIMMQIQLDSSRLEQEKARILGKELAIYNNGVRSYIAKNIKNLAAQPIGTEIPIGIKTLKHTDCNGGLSTDHHYVPCGLSNKTTIGHLTYITTISIEGTTDVPEIRARTTMDVLMIGGKIRPDLAGLAAITALGQSLNISGNSLQVNTSVSMVDNSEGIKVIQMEAFDAQISAPWLEIDGGNTMHADIQFDTNNKKIMRDIVGVNQILNRNSSETDGTELKLGYKPDGLNKNIYNILSHVLVDSNLDVNAPNSIIMDTGANGVGDYTVDAQAMIHVNSMLADITSHSGNDTRIEAKGKVTINSGDTTLGSAGNFSITTEDGNFTSKVTGEGKIDLVTQNQDIVINADAEIHGDALGGEFMAKTTHQDISINAGQTFSVYSGLSEPNSNIDVTAKGQISFQSQGADGMTIQTVSDLGTDKIGLESLVGDIFIKSLDEQAEIAISSVNEMMINAQSINFETHSGLMDSDVIFESNGHMSLIASEDYLEEVGGNHISNTITETKFNSGNGQKITSNNADIVYSATSGNLTNDTNRIITTGHANSKLVANNRYSASGNYVFNQSYNADTMARGQLVWIEGQSPASVGEVGTVTITSSDDIIEKAERGQLSYSASSDFESISKTTEKTAGSVNISLSKKLDYVAAQRAQLKAGNDINLLSSAMLYGTANQGANLISGNTSKLHSDESIYLRSVNFYYEGEKIHNKAANINETADGDIHNNALTLTTSSKTNQIVSEVANIYYDLDNMDIEASTEINFTSRDRLNIYGTELTMTGPTNTTFTTPEDLTIRSTNDLIFYVQDELILNPGLQGVINLPKDGDIKFTAQNDMVLASKNGANIDLVYSDALDLSAPNGTINIDATEQIQFYNGIDTASNTKVEFHADQDFDIDAPRIGLTFRDYNATTAGESVFYARQGLEFEANKSANDYSLFSAQSGMTLTAPIFISFESSGTHFFSVDLQGKDGTLTLDKLDYTAPMILDDSEPLSNSAPYGGYTYADGAYRKLQNVGDALNKISTLVDTRLTTYKRFADDATCELTKGLYECLETYDTLISDNVEVIEETHADIQVIHGHAMSHSY